MEPIEGQKIYTHYFTMQCTSQVECDARREAGLDAVCDDACDARREADLDAVCDVACDAQREAGLDAV